MRHRHFSVRGGTRHDVTWWFAFKDSKVFHLHTSYSPIHPLSIDRFLPWMSLNVDLWGNMDHVRYKRPDWWSLQTSRIFPRSDLSLHPSNRDRNTVLLDKYEEYLTFLAPLWVCLTEWPLEILKVRSQWPRRKLFVSPWECFPRTWLEARFASRFSVWGPHNPGVRVHFRQTSSTA